MNYTNDEILHYLLIIILQYNNRIHIYYLHITTNNYLSWLLG